MYRRIPIILYSMHKMMDKNINTFKERFNLVNNEDVC